MRPATKWQLDRDTQEDVEVLLSNSKRKMRRLLDLSLHEPTLFVSLMSLLPEVSRGFYPTIFDDRTSAMIRTCSNDGRNWISDRTVVNISLDGSILTIYRYIDDDDHYSRQSHDIANPDFDPEEVMTRVVKWLRTP
jgi:hypothetical protein